MDKTFNTLKSLIEKRKKRLKSRGSEMFIIWGIVILTGSLIRTFLINSGLVIILTLTAGVIVQTVYIRMRFKVEGFEMIWNNEMSLMWDFTILVIILSGVIFPVYFKLYSEQTGAVLMFFFAAPGAFISSLWLKKWSIIISPFIFILTSIFLSLPFPENKAFIYTTAIIFGLIIPGIISKFEGHLPAD